MRKEQNRVFKCFLCRLKMTGGVVGESMYLATKGMAYYSYWGSNFQTIQWEGGWMHWQYSCDKAVSDAIPTAVTVHYSQRPAWQAEVLWKSSASIVWYNSMECIRCEELIRMSWQPRCSPFHYKSIREMRKEVVIKRRGSREIRRQS